MAPFIIAVKVASQRAMRYGNGGTVGIHRNC
jgi:hypothetical protein